MFVVRLMNLLIIDFTAVIPAKSGIHQLIRYNDFDSIMRRLILIKKPGKLFCSG